MVEMKIVIWRNCYLESYYDYILPIIFFFTILTNKIFELISFPLTLSPKYYYYLLFYIFFNLVFILLLILLILLLFLEIGIR